MKNEQIETNRISDEINKQKRKNRKTKQSHGEQKNSIERFQTDILVCFLANKQRRTTTNSNCMCIKVIELNKVKQN